jgi:hypothetical protein
LLLSERDSSGKISTKGKGGYQMNKWGAYVVRLALALSTLAGLLVAGGAAGKWG